MVDQNTCINNNQEISKRFEWIDIFKAITIAFVVIGHATGLFNVYIYQFHMAAFFFISGVTAHLEKKSLLNVLVNKFFTLLLPLFSLILLGTLVNIILNAIGVYDTLFNLPNQGLKTILIFLRNGDLYIQWLGATWFLIVLFGIFVLQKILFVICDNKVNPLYLFLTFILFLIGVTFIKDGYNPHLSFIHYDLILFSQIFFTLGVVFTQVIKNILSKLLWLENIKYKSITISIVLIINIILFFIFKKLGITIDYPSRRVPNVILVLLAGINGTILVICISKLIELIPSKFRMWISVVGKNSLGILFFHFVFFKLIFVVLYWCKVISLEELGNVVPPASVGNTYWPLLVIVSISLSTLLWIGINKIPYVNIAFGGTRKTYASLYNKLVSSMVGNKVNEIKTRIITKYKEGYNYLKNQIISHPFVSLGIVALVIGVIIPLYVEKIMCNDELQSRLWSSRGFKTFYIYFVKDQIFNKGRALSSWLFSFNMWCGFIGQSNYTYKVVQILSICACIIVFALLVNKIFRNRNFAIFVSLFILVFIPISFEHTAPNAFTTMYNIPLAFLFFSLILYIDYFRKNEKKYLIASLVIFLFVCMSYESFVTYTPVYFLLTFIEKKEDTFKKKILECIPALCTGVGYLVLYVICAKLFPSSYTGNQIAKINILSSLKIIWYLLLASFPGFYVFNGKYQYLYEVYKSNIDFLDYIRVAMVIVPFVFFIYLLQRNKQRENKYIVYIIVTLSCIIISILPSLPLSISSMYQGNVGPSGFLALPVTFFSYFSTCLLICFWVWELLMVSKPIWIKMIIGGLCGLILIPVQLMNSSFSKETNKNFTRIENIEKFLRTESILIFDKYEYYSEDLYQTQNALGIHDGYWTSFCEINGRTISIKKGGGNSSSNYLYLLNDTTMVMLVDDNVAIYSISSLEKELEIHNYDSSISYVASCYDASIDKGVYIYSFVIESSSLNSCNLIDFKANIK